MALDYIVTKRVFGFDENKTEKYVVAPVSSGEVSFEKLCTQVNQICGVHRGLVQLVVAGMIDAIVNNLDDGKSVRLGDFGIFRPTFNAKAADSAEEASAKCIYRRKIHYTPGKAFKNVMKDLSVTRFAVPDRDWTTSGGANPGDGGGSNPGDGGEGGWVDPSA